MILSHTGWSPRFSSEIWVEASVTLLLVHAWKTCVVWIMSRSVAGLSSSQAPLEHGCSGFWGLDGWSEWNESWRLNSLGDPSRAGAPGPLFLNRRFTLCFLEVAIGGVLLIIAMSLWYLLVLVQSTGFLLNDTSLFNSHISFGPKFAHGSF